MTISNSAMLIELNISVWTAQRVDRKTSDKVTSDAKATADAGLFRKNLLAGTSARKEIADFAAQCRTWHNSQTLPWSDKGARLLPTSMFFDYSKDQSARRARFEFMVDKFLNDYPKLVQTANVHLGELFDPAEYPSVDEVRDKFAYKMVFSPVPEAGDFRLDIGAQDLANLQSQYEDAYQTRLNDAMRTAWDKLHSMLTTMSEKLVEPEGDTTKIFHTTFVSNAAELCSLLTHLNLTKDPELERARQQLERAIYGVDIVDIRQNVATRADIKGQVDASLTFDTEKHTVNTAHNVRNATAPKPVRCGEKVVYLLRL